MYQEFYCSLYSEGMNVGYINGRISKVVRSRELLEKGIRRLLTLDRVVRLMMYDDESFDNFEII
jgi:hypothetical protein